MRVQAMAIKKPLTSYKLLTVFLIHEKILLPYSHTPILLTSCVNFF
jgi:hypothetical protein